MSNEYGTMTTRTSEDSLNAMIHDREPYKSIVHKNLPLLFSNTSSCKRSRTIGRRPSETGAASTVELLLRNPIIASMYEEVVAGGGRVCS